MEETFNIKEAKVVEYKDEKSFLSSLFGAFSKQSYNAGAEFRRGAVGDIGVKV